MANQVFPCIPIGTPVLKTMHAKHFVRLQLSSEQYTMDKHRHSALSLYTKDAFFMG